jgi:hypothetical protein
MRRWPGTKKREQQRLGKDDRNGEVACGAVACGNGDQNGPEKMDAFLSLRKNCLQNPSRLNEGSVCGNDEMARRIKSD